MQDLLDRLEEVRVLAAFEDILGASLNKPNNLEFEGEKLNMVAVDRAHCSGLVHFPSKGRGVGGHTLLSHDYVLKATEFVKRINDGGAPILYVQEDENMPVIIGAEDAEYGVAIAPRVRKDV